MRTISHFIFCISMILLNSCFYTTPGKAGQLPYYTAPGFTPHWLNARQAVISHHIPEFSFINQQGNTVSWKELDNKITVVNFFFTSCPGICKQLTNNLSRVQEVFKDGDNVRLLSHSVTPERDSVPVLSRYALANGIIPGKWHLVTGNRAVIYSIARSAYFADEDLGTQQDSTSFLHTENILLIDRQHCIRGVYKGTHSSEMSNLIADIKKLEDGE